MTKEINEKQVIELMTLKGYQEFGLGIYNTMKNTDTYKAKNAVVYFTGNAELPTGEFFHFQATLKKGMIDDFDFTRMVLTDDRDFSFNQVNDTLF